jgi:peptide/nickel transport system permease protein
VLFFILSRLLQALPVLLIVGLISFAMSAFLGDPLQFMLGQDYDESQRLALVHQLGLDQPFYDQYLRFLGHMLHGQFGVSYRVGIPVTELIGRAFPATAELVLVSMGFSLLIGVALGIYTALRPRSAFSGTVMMASLIGISVPTFVVGIVLILLFSVDLGWLPSSGRGRTVDLGIWTSGLLTWSGLKALILPSVTIALYQTTLIMRLVRTQMLSVLRSDYIRFARARGLGARVIHFSYALRNALIPIVTVVGLQIGGVLSFAVVTESVFQWPGMGLLLVQSIKAVDIPVIAAYLMLICAVFVLINLVVDLLYLAIDPGLRKSSRGTA